MYAREIGGEYWLDSIPTDLSKGTIDWLNIGHDQCLLFSGRTAIDFVLEDMCRTRAHGSNSIQSVYMPSYCCESMLQPFRDRSMHIDFYDVVIDDNGLKYLIDLDKVCDVFFATSYFGFSRTVMDSKIEFFRSRGITVIEDITHRLLAESPSCDMADYSIASLRKWFAIPSGGLAVKQKDCFAEQRLKAPSSLIDLKINAMLKKADYIRKESIGTINDSEKQAFLSGFKDFNRLLQLCYKGLMIDNLSKRILSKVDTAAVRKARRQNADYLFRAIKNYKSLRLIVPPVDLSKDCPLFIPLRVESRRRAATVDYLIRHKIYCPVHWPVPSGAQLDIKTKRVYEEELSLVCDQRYHVHDMARIITTLENLWNNSF